MGHEWIEIIKRNKAFSQKQYSQACGLYTEVWQKRKKPSASAHPLGGKY